ncbi:MAG: histidine triad nucleotide-binding protein [Pseudomonadota bacterium]
MTDTLFTQIANGDVPADIVFETEDVIAFRDINPQAPTHILIVPRKPIPTINDIEPEDELVVGRLFSAAKAIAANEGLSDDGYRVVMNCNQAAGQTVFHIHLHLLGGRNLSWPPG